MRAEASRAGWEVWSPNWLRLAELHLPAGAELCLLPSRSLARGVLVDWSRTNMQLQHGMELPEPSWAPFAFHTCPPSSHPCMLCLLPALTASGQRSCF